MLLTNPGFIITESVRTVRNRLWENDLHAGRHYIGCVLTQRHHQNRLNWARVYTRWIRRRWNAVFVCFGFFRINQYFLYNVVMAGRNERYDDCCVLKRDRFGVVCSVMD